MSRRECGKPAKRMCLVIHVYGDDGGDANKEKQARNFSNRKCQ
jgi:hypothetical protein